MDGYFCTILILHRRLRFSLLFRRHGAGEYVVTGVRRDLAETGQEAGCRYQVRSRD
jgi:hypothetical protein